MRVKICGIKTLDNAIAAAEAGADMLGFNFFPPSKRFISVEACREIQTGLHRRGLRPLAVGVFVNASLEEIQQIMAACGLDLAQLSGDEPPLLVTQLGGRAFKALRPDSLAAARTAVSQFPHRKSPPGFLIDAFRPGEFGGTGQVGDWPLAKILASEFELLLAGGLTPQNVSRAITEVRPWGVDVASGVESAPGIQDPDRIRAFVQTAKHI